MAIEEPNFTVESKSETYEIRSYGPVVVAETRIAMTAPVTQSHFNEKLTTFRKALTSDRLEVNGEPVFARFNSPFRLWFLRRNEIWIEIKDKPASSKSKG